MFTLINIKPIKLYAVDGIKNSTNLFKALKISAEARADSCKWKHVTSTENT